MGSKMLAHTVPGHETLPTPGTAVHHLSPMESLVYLELSELSEGMSALGTLIWLLGGMSSLVSRGVIFIHKSFPTYSARIRLIFAVILHVYSETTERFEQLSTHSTLMGLFFVV